MTAFNRWCIVALGVVLLIGVPLAVRALPAQDEGISATDLLARIEASRDHPYSGYVESQGNLQLPITDRFTDIGALFGERTRMRVWWRGAEEWRVDKLLVAGETDLIRNAGGTTQWSYEAAEATPATTRPFGCRGPPIWYRPRSAPGCWPTSTPPSSAGCRPGRWPARTRWASGCPRPRPSRASVAPISGWTRRPVFRSPSPCTRARTTGPRSRRSSVSSPRETPDVARTTFTPPPAADIAFEGALDIADAANLYAPVLPPPTLVGLAKSPAAIRAVGVYGSGVTQIIVIPLRDREAHPLREQLGSWPGSRLVPEGIVLSVGPLGLLLTGDHEDSGWLIAGTVTEDTLATAARELVRHSVFVGDLP